MTKVYFNFFFNFVIILIFLVLSIFARIFCVNFFSICYHKKVYGENLKWETRLVGLAVSISHYFIDPSIPINDRLKCKCEFSDHFLNILASLPPYPTLFFPIFQQMKRYRCKGSLKMKINPK